MGKPVLASSFFPALRLCERRLHPAAVCPRPPRVMGHPLLAQYLFLLRDTVLLRRLLRLQIELVCLAQLALPLFRFGENGLFRELCSWSRRYR